MKTIPASLSEKELYGKPFMWCIILVLWVSGTFPAWGLDTVNPHVAILISKNIRPYIETTEGIKRELSEKLGADIEIFSIENYSENTIGTLTENLINGQFLTVVGVGPEAIQFMRNDLSNFPFPMIYSMILHTRKLDIVSKPDCGIPLNIPVESQLKQIKEGLPSIKRLGLIYDPAYNTPFFIEASTYARSLGMELISLAVSSKKDIPAMLKSNWPSIDGLWMIPDQTVISESIIQYVIKQALFNYRPVVGYNKFFYESGAALAFIFDYEELGRQTARMAISLIDHGYCREEPPVFHTWLNRRVLNRIGLSPSETEDKGITEGP